MNRANFLKVLAAAGLMPALPRDDDVDAILAGTTEPRPAAPVSPGRGSVGQSGDLRMALGGHKFTPHWVSLHQDAVDVTTWDDAYRSFVPGRQWFEIRASDADVEQVARRTESGEVVEMRAELGAAGSFAADVYVSDIQRGAPDGGAAMLRAEIIGRVEFNL